MSDPEPRNVSGGRGLDFLVGGEMGALMRSTDWARTPLGPAEAWPQSLKTAVGICLSSRFPIVLWWGPEMRMIYNDAYRPALGALKHPAVGRAAKEVWPEIWHVIGPMLEGVLASGEATWSADLLLPMDRYGFLEETYWTYSYSPIRDESGGVGGIFTAVQETTARVLGERRLKILKELGATATADSVEAACLAASETLSADPSDVPFALLYRLSSDGTEAVLCGATAGLGEAAGRFPRRVELAGDDDGWPLARVVRSGEEVVVEDVVRRFGRLPGGAWEHAPERAVVLPLREAAGEKLSGVMVAGVSAGLALTDDYRSFFGLAAGHIATAISNARAYAEERRRAEALAELDRAKTAFFSNISHEFRTPLTLMLGPLEELLQGERRLPAEVREPLAAVHRNGQRLLKLVNTLLDFSRIEAGRVQASYEPVDLAAFTAELASVFRSAIEKAGLRLRIDCAPLSKPVHVDRDMWEKIVLNLLSNAFKYTLDGEIRVRLREAGGQAVLSVADTGAGIPAHELPHVFARFHRVEGAKGRTAEGSGIGLALVQELIRLHGGTVVAESVVGEGSTFTVRVPLGVRHLPRERIAAPREPTSTALGATPFVEEALRWSPGAERTEAPGDDGPLPGPAAPGGARPRVVLADDNADMREYICRLLSPRYEVIAVPDGRAALAAASEWAPDLVLTDVMMPELDGFGLLRALRGDPRTASTPVVMLSARAGEEARVEGLRAGADDYLIKPFSARELLARVEGTLALALARREAVRREEELRAETTGVLESIGEGFLAIDRDWRITHVNAAAERMLGTTRGEIVGEDHWEVFPAALGTALEREYRRVAQTREVVHFEEFFAPRGRWFELSLYPGRDGGLVVYLRDISERKADEAARARQHERLTLLGETAAHLLFEGRPEVMVRGMFERVREHLQVDMYLNFAVDASGEGLALVSYAGVPEAVARSLSRLALGEAICGAVARDRRAIEAACVQQSDDPAVQLVKSLGLRVYCCNPLIAGERVLGTLSFGSRTRDRFDAHELEFMRTLCHYAAAAFERVRLIGELREEDRKKDEFLAVLAHELRNPLAPLRNGLEVLRLTGGEAEAMHRARAMMERQVSHLVRLIDDLLDVSRISQNKLTLRRGRRTLAEVVASAVETARPVIEAAGHALTVTLPDGPVLLDADLTRLAQVFGNLLTNAAKYTPPRGRIGLAAELQGGEVVVSVRDTGIGIPHEALPRIFDMFSQVDRSIERATGGLGIGLALVKGLVEMHGGTVLAESAGAGRGSTFTVRLPTLPEVARAGEEGPGERVIVAIPRRVLVVDDNRDSAESMAMMLSLLGSEVRTAHDGLEALAVAETYRPQVILMDVGMPRLNGLDATRRIRERPWGAGVRIVALTGWGQDADRLRSQQAGCDGHLVKPVELRELERLLAGLT